MENERSWHGAEIKHNEIELALLARTGKMPLGRYCWRSYSSGENHGDVGGDWSAQAPAIHLPALSGARAAASTGSAESDL
jgi:hypothetical protein